MKKSKISESQIVAAIKEHESGKTAADICRNLGYIRLPFTIGRRSTLGWIIKNFGALKNWRRRIAD